MVSGAERLPPGGAVGEWASALAHGVRYCDGLASNGRAPLDVPLYTGVDRHIRAVPGTRVSRDPLPETDVVTVNGIPCTTPLRSCFDGMRKASSLTEAVVVGDLWLASELVTRAEFTAYADAHARWRGLPQVRRALPLLDGQARGPWETRLRMVWVLDAQLPAPLVNPPVFDASGSLLGYPDLLDPEAATAFEYDGDGHREIGQHTQDNRREETFEHHGLVVGRVTRLDMRSRSEVARRMRRTRARGLRRDPAQDRWTLTPPPQWYPGGPRDAVLGMLEEMDRHWQIP